MIKKLFNVICISLFSFTLLGCIKQEVYISIKTSSADPFTFSVDENEPVNVKVKNDKPVNVNTNVKKENINGVEKVNKADFPLIGKVPPIPQFNDEDLKNHALIERTLVEHIKDLRHFIDHYNDRLDKYLNK